MLLPGFWVKNCPIKASYFSRIIIINQSGGSKSSLDAEYQPVECVIHQWGGLRRRRFCRGATCCTTTASGRGTMSSSKTTTERSEVVESLTRATQLSGDGCTRLRGCLTFHREQKTTQLTAWGMLAWPEDSYGSW